MGNTAAKDSDSEQRRSSKQTGGSSGGSGSGGTTAAGPAVPRKYSTVSTARLFIYGEKIEYLTEEQKGHIRTCWKTVENDVQRVGVITFMQ